MVVKKKSRWSILKAEATQNYTVRAPYEFDAVDPPIKIKAPDTIEQMLAIAALLDNSGAVSRAGFQVVPCDILWRFLPCSMGGSAPRTVRGTSAIRGRAESVLRFASCGRCRGGGDPGKRIGLVQLIERYYKEIEWDLQRRNVDPARFLSWHSTVGAVLSLRRAIACGLEVQVCSGCRPGAREIDGRGTAVEG